MEHKNGQIDHNEDKLEQLHLIHDWIPGRANIRPSKETLEKKRQILNTELLNYDTPLEHILSTVFCLTLPVKVPSEPICCFLPNRFPYETPKGTNHWILWLWPWTLGNKEDIINTLIEEELNKIVKGLFRFVYYVNPKMTFPDVFHVQVFWTLWPRHEQN